MSVLTFRTFMEKTEKYVGWHICRYSKWVDAGKGDITGSNGKRSGRYIEQERRCIICNKLETRQEIV